jgi:quinohemoprotein amine dehydrogenase
MMLIDDVDLAPAEKDHIIQYLSTHHGLAPEEARTVIYDVERRSHEETDIPKAVMTACARCHNLARALSWRRSAADWKEFSNAHFLRYNAPAGEDVIAFLEKEAPLWTKEWTGWSSPAAGKNPAGRWLVTASVLGRIKYLGELQLEAAGPDGQFNTRAALQSVTDGTAFVRSGHGIMYGGYAWRGSSKGSNTAGSAPDDLSNEAREVLTISPDGSTAAGRWFWGQYQELGVDIKIQRGSSDGTLLGVDGTLLKTGSHLNRVRLLGEQFPPQISPGDLDFGTGIVVRRIVSHNSSEIVVDADVAVKAPAGKRNIAFRHSVLPAAVAVYDHVDYIKVVPESAMSAFAEVTRSRGYQQFEAIAYQNGPDGKRHTKDDIELAPVDVTWSMKIFYESDNARTEVVGSVSPTGLFIPAAESPKKNFDVWVIAQAKADKDEEGQPLAGKAYLVVTVPSYVFNGRRYVREFDRWVDDGPVGPAQR